MYSWGGGWWVHGVSTVPLIHPPFATPTSARLLPVCLVERSLAKTVEALLHEWRLAKYARFMAEEGYVFVQEFASGG